MTAPHAMAVEAANLPPGVVINTESDREELARIIDRTCRVTEREQLLAECRDEIRRLAELFMQPSPCQLVISESVRRMHAMTLELLLARLDDATAQPPR